MTALLIGLLESIFGQAFKALFASVETSRARADLDAAHERAGAAEAANETQQTISDIADERTRLALAPDSPVDLAKRLRDRAQRIRAAGRARRDAGGDA
jgi:hypothetical protein